MLPPPRGGRAGLHVSRPRLLARLAEATDCKLTIVTASPGYGKSALVSEYLQNVREAAALYRLTPADQNPTRLAGGLAACLGGLLREPPQRPSVGVAGVGVPAGAPGRIVRPGRAETPAPTRYWRALLKRAKWKGEGSHSLSVLYRGLLRWMHDLDGTPTLLVLDDFQNIDRSEHAGALIQRLMEQSPESMHFVVLSRSVPQLPLGRLRAQQQLSELGEKELAFTLEESTRMLRDGTALGLTDEQIALVHERMEGWAAGIATVRQSLRYGRRGPVLEILSDRRGCAGLVCDYLAQEVFDCQEAATQDFLLRTSILAQMSDEACNWLLQTSSSLRTLLRLESGGLFTTAADPLLRTFRYHQLFQEFLSRRLQEQEPSEAVHALHARAAEFYRARCQWEFCVHHLFKAGLAVQAAEVIEGIGERHILAGLSQTVESWLRSLPEPLTSARPWLLALRGRLAHISGSYEEARHALERANLQFQASGDESGLAWTCGELAFVNYRSGLIAQSIRGYGEALSWATPHSLLRVRLLVRQATTYRVAGILDRAVAGCQMALQELSGIDDKASRDWGQSMTMKNLALAQMECGHLHEAYANAQNALSISSDCQLGESNEAWALVSLGIVQWAMGDLREASARFERAMLLAGYREKHLQRYVSLWWGNCLRDTGKLMEAQKIYRMGTTAADLERIFAEVRAGEAEKVRPEIADLYQRQQRSECVPDRIASEVVMSTVLRACGEPREALAHATRSVDLARGKGYRPRLASALLHKARLEYELSQQWAGRESLAEALALAESDRYFHFFWWDPAMVGFLCAQALAADLSPEFLRELFVRRPDLPRGGVLTTLLENPQARVRRRAISVLAALPRQETTSLEGDPLSACSDPQVRRRLAKAIDDRIVTRLGLEVLHSSYELSWREVDVFVEYYLRPAVQASTPSLRWREVCAAQMGLSENTLRCHINSVRHKLARHGYSPQEGVLRWAEGEGLLASQAPSRLTDSEESIPYRASPSLQ